MLKQIGTQGYSGEPEARQIDVGEIETATVLGEKTQLSEDVQEGTVAQAHRRNANPAIQGRIQLNPAQQPSF
jgi:hypothetical protein